MKPTKKMTEKRIANLIQVKTALMDKNSRLAAVAGSAAKRKHFLHRAKRCRDRVATLRFAANQK